MVIALLWRHVYTLCHTLLGSQSQLCSLMQMNLLFNITFKYVTKYTPIKSE